MSLQLCSCPGAGVPYACCPRHALGPVPGWRRKAGPGHHVLLLGYRDAPGSGTRCLAEKQAAARTLCVFGGFIGNSSNSWHKHFSPPVTGAHTSESIRLLRNVMTVSVDFCTQNGFLQRGYLSRPSGTVWASGPMVPLSLEQGQVVEGARVDRARWWRAHRSSYLSTLHLWILGREEDSGTFLGRAAGTAVTSSSCRVPEWVSVASPSFGLAGNLLLLQLHCWL